MACTSPGRSLNHLRRLKSRRYKWSNMRSEQGDSVGQRSRRCGSGDGSSALVRRGDHARAHSLRRGRHSWKVAIGGGHQALTRTPTGWRLSLGFSAFRAVGNKCVSYTPQSMTFCYSSCLRRERAALILAPRTPEELLSLRLQTTKCRSRAFLVPRPTDMLRVSTVKPNCHKRRLFMIKS